MLCGNVLNPCIADAKQKHGKQSASAELNTIRGVIKPKVEAVISSEIPARIKRFPFSVGQHFTKGQILVEFDCSRLKAELAAAQAEVEARQKTLENSKQLLKLNGIGQLEVEIAAADYKKARATMKVAYVNVRECQIRAPFSGRVVKTLVNEYESVNPYDQLLSILNDNQFEIELILPSKSLQWLKKGAKFSFTIDETEQVLSAKVTQLGASIDPVSQTIRAMGTFENKPKHILAGMSGSATFNHGPQKKNGLETGKTEHNKNMAGHSTRMNQQATPSLNTKPTKNYLSGRRRSTIP